MIFHIMSIHIKVSLVTDSENKIGHYNTYKSVNGETKLP